MSAPFVEAPPLTVRVSLGTGLPIAKGIGRTRMGEIGPDERTLLCDDLFAEHEITGTIDAVCSKEFAITEVEAAEAAALSHP